MMEAFITELLAPRGFWGVTSADHLAASSIDAMFQLPDDGTDGPGEAPVPER
jgi:hypothetical protein